MCLKCIILFKNRQALGVLRWGLLIFNFGELKLRNLAKLCFFKPIMTKSNFKNINYDVILVT